MSQPDGAVLYDDGPSQGCEPRQALVLAQDRLACNWYSPRPVRTGAAAPASKPVIFLATVPPVAIVGECITETAQVVPAIVLPQGHGAGRRAGGAGTHVLRGAGCGGSGVTVNGRATGQSADCRQ
ncbi:hypothetical protein MNBD_ALPHA09-991 [hydrothermal vent metagenome]|uniref:Uncharacterized protein n=1 Tax=hydrothermal vent metagenome TaxID=652676 RepID=A0A3B0TQR7_9ZZZZ